MSDNLPANLPVRQSKTLPSELTQTTEPPAPVSRVTQTLPSLPGMVLASTAPRSLHPLRFASDDKERHTWAPILRFRDRFRRRHRPRHLAANDAAWRSRHRRPGTRRGSQALRRRQRSPRDPHRPRAVQSGPAICRQGRRRTVLRPRPRRVSRSRRALPRWSFRCARALPDPRAGSRGREYRRA